MSLSRGEKRKDWVMRNKFLRGINVSFLLLIIISTFSSCANEMNVFEGNNR